MHADLCKFPCDWLLFMVVVEKTKQKNVKKKQAHTAGMVVRKAVKGERKERWKERVREEQQPEKRGQGLGCLFCKKEHLVFICWPKHPEVFM